MSMRIPLALLLLLTSGAVLSADVVPAVFAPGVVSTGDDEWGFTMTADGGTVYFNKADRGYKLQIIVEASRSGDGWSAPRVASFSGRFRDIDPALSPDGRMLVFASNRPRTPDGEIRKDFDLWAVDRLPGGGWSAPRHLGDAVNSEGSETNSSIASDGTLYFAGSKVGGGNRSLYRARRSGEGYGVPEKLPAPINTDEDESNHFIAADQSYLLFLSSRAGGHADSDLYIVFRKGDAWSPPRNLGPAINRPGTSGVFTPFVSADGKTLYYAARFTTPEVSPAQPLTYDQVLARLRTPGNGQGDLYSQPWDADDYR